MSAQPVTQTQPLETIQVTKLGKDELVRSDTGEKFCRRGWFIWGVICLVLVIISLIPLAFALLTGVIAVGAVAAGSTASSIKN